MALRLGALHDALLRPGDANLARLAAEEVAGYENRLASVESDLMLLKWMVSVNLALTTLILGIVFRLLGRA